MLWIYKLNKDFYCIKDAIIDFDKSSTDITETHTVLNITTNVLQHLEITSYTFNLKLCLFKLHLIKTPNIDEADDRGNDILIYASKYGFTGLILNIAYFWFPRQHPFRSLVSRYLSLILKNSLRRLILMSVEVKFYYR